MSKNIVVLSASPRKGGNSDILCDQFILGAEEAGHKAEKIFLRDKKINYCVACDTCHHFEHIYHRLPVRETVVNVLKMMTWAKSWIKWLLLT
ncbi:flavodoxin family protein [Methanobacterium formicicum]|uniref:flavodoxin family protein n=1 Tax=Methanobacterium formicicum TaxID=2162 RepID=UPI002492BF99|nr:NAD(P)H-dependent oxidoreductase [Methanobacterium formicicum]